MSGIHSISEKYPAIAIIQARMGSTRLQGKSMINLAGHPLVYHVLERAKAITGVQRVVLATGTGRENFPLIDLAHENECEAFAGSEDDVLNRFYRVSEKYPCSYIIRITGDNPFTDSTYASETLRVAMETEADNAALTGLPLGTAVEIISAEALASAHRNGREKYHREHVSPYIKERPEEFKIVRHPSGFQNPFKDLRLTVDTEEDFELAEKIYDTLYRGSLFSLGEVISFLQKNPSLVSINSSIKQRPMTHSGDA